jgi:DNA segregation ATPase FtsK/SpoIIIE-like protein
VAGKTRSGKTTGIISLLLQILLMGPDGHGSEVVVVDPKRAELSRLPHVVAPDGDGDAHSILDAMRAFATSMTERQAYLNNLSAETGDAVKWWDAGMHPSFLFIDEYVAARTLLPQRAPKDDPGYSLKEFDDLLKRIVTMGASAGCFVIVSIAEASVDSGGLPAMLRSAMGTKVLFRPTMPEACLMWDAERLRDMPERAYGPGEAWFSSTDGVHDGVAYVRFPVMRFRLYDELGHLLMAYGE